MKSRALGWVCLEGTNSASTCSTLGTNFHLRRGMFQEAWNHGYVVNFFSCKKDGYLYDDEAHPKINDWYSVTVVVLHALRRYTRIAKAKNKKVGESQSRWIISKSIDYVLKHAKFPRCDVVWVDYVDPGFPAIVLSMSVMVHYARRNVPMVLRDPILKFRYLTIIKPIHLNPRKTMYEERIQRYISDEHIEAIRRSFVMGYAFDTSWGEEGGDKFCLGFETLDCLYDPGNELEFNFEGKRKRLTYVGNVNAREKVMIHYYGAVKKYPIHVWGRWPADVIGRVREVNPRIRFKGIVPWEKMDAVYARARVCIHITRDDYARLDLIPERHIEVARAGTLLLSPSSNKASPQMTLDDFVFDDISSMNTMVRKIMRMRSSTYGAALEEFRKHLYDQFSSKRSWATLMRIKNEYF